MVLMTTRWMFSVDDAGDLTVQPPPESRSLPVDAVLDWLEADVGRNARSAADYRELWESAFDVAGNATMQTLDGDEVIFEALYEQWEDFRMPLATFEQILTDYREFLERRAAERAAGNPPT
jgi:hypothetical protein